MKNPPLLQNLQSRTQPFTVEEIGLPWKCLILALPEGGLNDPLLAKLDEGCGGAMSRAIAAGDFSGEAEEVLLLRPAQGAERLVVVGLGPEAKLREDGVRRAFAAAIKRAVATGAEEAAILLQSFAKAGISVPRTMELIAETVGLALWRFVEFLGEERHKQISPLSFLDFLVPEKEDIEAVNEALLRGGTAANATAQARLWASLPSNLLTPARFADIAVNLAAVCGIGVDVFDETELAERGFNAILAVGGGSANPPRLVILDTAPESNEAPIALVGKGITFDSGGISIKPSADMHQMKGDMSGAATVLAAVTAYMKLGGSRRVVAVLPLAENMPGTGAYRPGDIIRTWSGKTVEVLNTDAEGRLVLADALAYAADRYKPAALVDIATLTGAIMIALGGHAIGLFTTDDTLWAALDRAGTSTWERVWRMPLWDEYAEQIKSAAADIQNIGGRPAGSITAAMFLRQFVGDTPWAHLDIAGVDWREKDGPYQTAGPTGTGARLLLEYLLGN